MYNPTYIQDFYNRALEKSITYFDYPQVVKLTWIYSLPLGHGQKFLASGRLADRLAGGWQVTAIQRYGSGDPLDIYSGDAYSYITPTVRGDVVPGVAQKVTPGPLNPQGTPYLNSAAFADPPLTPDGAALRPGTAPRYLPNVRGPGHEEEDFGLIKNTKITERVTFQLRGDFSNVFNRTGRGDPSDTGVTDGLFGMVTGPMNGPRVIQVGGHINF
jgi:hypothetical protein